MGKADWAEERAPTRCLPASSTPARPHRPLGPPLRVHRFLRRPSDYMPAFEEALKEIVDHMSAKPKVKTEYFIGVEGSFGANQVSPRGLLCHLLNALVCVEGLVTRCESVHPKVVQTVHFCDATKAFTTRDYRDLTAISGVPAGSTAYPTKDDEGNLLTTEFGLCTYRDHQVVTVQEMPERAPPGQMPRSVQVLLENELVDKCRPGDRVRIVGVYRALPSKQGHASGVRTMVLGNRVTLVSKESTLPRFTSGDLVNIKKLAKSANLLEEMTRSLAPSVYGHQDIKQALLLLLLGGVEKNLSNGTHLRGDVNILMVGDPSTAKSQILRFALNLAPLAVSTTGRGSSGVGLTAAVTHDPDTGERRLEAGALVKADRGICCIDEFDKMLDADRVAIHEVMEQQTVTISKVRGGLHGGRRRVAPEARAVGRAVPARVAPCKAGLGLPWLTPPRRRARPPNPALARAPRPASTPPSTRGRLCSRRPTRSTASTTWTSPPWTTWACQTPCSPDLTSSSSSSTPRAPAATGPSQVTSCRCIAWPPPVPCPPPPRPLAAAMCSVTWTTTTPRTRRRRTRPCTSSLSVARSATETPRAEAGLDAVAER